MMTTKNYQELVKLKTFRERYEYLKLNGRVGEDTFGSSRFMNQSFYMSREWRDKRHEIIVRDSACDLGIEGLEIHGRLIVHHIVPITIEDVEHNRPILYDNNNLICVSDRTHNAIHYGDDNHLEPVFVERRPHDTTPWKTSKWK